MSLIQTYQGNQPGKTTLIMGGTHGDEKTGVLIVQKLNQILAKSGSDFSGQIITILANLQAIEKNQRYVDEDLNRLWSSQKTQEIESKKQLNNEEKVLLKIKPYLQQADVFVDIHATISPSEPFIFCQNSPQHLDLASFFEIQKIVSLEKDSNIQSMQVCTDDFVNANQGIGLTLETGWQKDFSKVDTFLNNILNLLKTKNHLKINQNLGILPEQKSTSKSQKPAKQIYTIYKHLKSPTQDLVYEQKIKSFAEFKQGQKIAVDSQQEYFADQDCFIIFPNNKSFYLGSITNLY